MKKTLLPSIVLAAGFILTSCNATMHTVGTGGRGDCKSPGQYDAKKKQWYIFWGLLPLNNVDSKVLAGGAKNYTIRTTTSFGDGLIAIPGSYLLGIRTQTIRVSKGNE
jgi:predicted small secreted protein